MKKMTHTQGGCGSTGLTLVELMVTLAILAIVLSLGAPSLMNTLQSQAVASATQTLSADLRFARSEALKRGSLVELCGATATTASGGATTYSCLADPTGNARSDWSTDGWIVRDSTTGDVLRVSQKPLGISGINASKASLPFLPTGILQGLAANVVIVPLMSNNTAATQVACVNTTGRARIVKGSSTC